MRKFIEQDREKIINILEEYVKPAVAADGGNIAFDSFDEENKIVKVILQGACSGCPSSTFTLKSGIENMLKSMWIFTQYNAAQLLVPLLIAG